MAEDHETTTEAAAPHIVEHWLHGKCEFKVHTKEETPCYRCVHSLVCSRNMEKLCQNYVWGCSDRHPGCHQCTNHYTRWDSKQPIPCFFCSFFRGREIHGYGYEVWSHIGDKQPWRIGIASHSIAQSRWIDHHAEEFPDEIPFTPEGCTLEYVPVLEVEYEWWSKQIREESSNLALFDEEWFKQHGHV